MLEVLNRYIHGYTAIPVILSCYKKGFFNVFANGEAFNVTQLAERLHAHEGNLQAALRMFESLGWLQRTQTASYNLSMTDVDLQSLQQIPAEIINLYAFPIENILSKFEAK